MSWVSLLEFLLTHFYLFLGHLHRFLCQETGISAMKNNRRFSLGSLFSRHKGFDRVNTEESDNELDHLNSDSEVEEYSATSSHKA